MLVAAAGDVRAQALTVQPVSIQLAAGQKTAVLTLINEGNRATSFQVRTHVWRQNGTGDAELTETDELLASPPLGTVAPAAHQVIRLVLRSAPQGKEATYRVLLDQIPPPAAPGMVQVALRLSIPIFAAPDTRTTPHVVWRIVNAGSQAWLVATNDGNSHLKVRDITLRSASGAVTRIQSANTSPYVLAGNSRRWRLVGRAPGGPLRVVANSDSGPIDQPVQ